MLFHKQVWLIVFVIFIFSCNNKPSKLPKTSSHRSSHIDDNKNTLSKNKNITETGHMDNIDESKGAYLYYDDMRKTNVLFLYMKLSKNKLKNALPSDDIDPKNTYLTGSFVDGTDYIGQGSYKNIIEEINNRHMINILTKDYKEVHKTLQSLKISEFNDHVSFAKKQFENID